MSEEDDKKDLFFAIARKRQLERDMSEYVHADLVGRAEIQYQRALLSDPLLMLTDKKRIDTFRIHLIELGVVVILAIVWLSKYL